MTTEQPEVEAQAKMDKVIEMANIGAMYVEALQSMKDILRVNTAFDGDKGLVHMSIVYQRRKGEEIRHFFIKDIERLQAKVKEIYNALTANNDERHHGYLQGVAVEMALEDFAVQGGA